MMLHPSYYDLIDSINNNLEPGEEPPEESRYSIVIAAAKRAREIVDGDEPLVKDGSSDKALSTAVEELYENKIRIVDTGAADEANPA